MTQKLLGIDVGTGGTRAVLLDASGRVLSAATAEHPPISSPQIGWAEQNPSDWWGAARVAIPECLRLAGALPSDIAAIGLSGQMHGLVLLDAGGEVLRPSLIWCDQRTGEQCAAIEATIGRRRLIELTANPALTGFTLPKIWWVREHEPEIWKRTRSVLLPKDYIRYCLTGERATDVSDASGTLMLDVANRKWSAEMLAASQISENLLPRVLESPEITGKISEAGARACGLRAGIPVVGGAGDQAGGAVGMGIVRGGVVSATIGTSGVVFAATDRPLLDPQGRVHTFCHAIPDRWHVMGVTQAAGLSLRWFRDQFGTRMESRAGSGSGSGSRSGGGPGANGAARDPYDALMDEARSVPAGSDGLLWAPYLMGERTPHLDPLARGALVGITAQHTRAHVVRAILEGVAFSLRDTFEILKQMKVPVESIRLGGGGARAQLWRQIQADVYGLPVAVNVAEEGAAYGAALLAGVGAGVWTSVPAACDAAVHVAQVVPCDAGRVALMEARYAEYSKLYPALRDIH
jgi:xylulokinase